MKKPRKRKKAKKKIEKLIAEGGARSNHFWKTRKKILNQTKHNEEYDLITEEGETITDPNKSKEFIAQHYEELYQAREGRPEHQKWTKHIQMMTQIIESNRNRMIPEEAFTTKEIKTAIKSLKRGKALGPDEIPNELLIEANSNTIEIYKKMMNYILKSGNIPEQWTEGKLIRLYKGKGTKGKCSNERGITLASNMGKLFERLINNRATPRVNMSEAQAGGTKGRATVDHILVLKELINIARKNKKQAYLIYGHLPKAPIAEQNSSIKLFTLCTILLISRYQF